jgi:hypothetical protein
MNRYMLHNLGRILSLVMLLIAFPPPSIAAQVGERCFSETGYCIAGRIREFWEQSGGLTVFGFPITPQQEELIEGRPFQVQWFERNRLELHPENQRPYDVLLGRLGADRLAQQGRDWFQFPKSQPQVGCRFFEATGHNVCGEILDVWRANGLELDSSRGKSEAENLALFGLPLSDAQTETIEGKEYIVQWFERARFELHLENAPPHNVLLGLLGNELGPTLERCSSARLVAPTGARDRKDAALNPVASVVVRWDPPGCVMVVQYYQRNMLLGEYRNVTYGQTIAIGSPGSGETEVKIWRHGAGLPADSIWVWVS